jgi:hypothetical protein
MRLPIATKAMVAALPSISDTSYAPTSPSRGG